MDESGFVHMTAEEEKRLSKLNTKRSSNGSSNLPPVNANTNNHSRPSVKDLYLIN
jgi:hypothetical protein